MQATGRHAAFPLLPQLWTGRSNPLKTCVFLKQNSTKTLQWVVRLQTHQKDVLIKLTLVTDTSMNHNVHMKRLDDCLRSGCMAGTIFPEEKILQTEIEGKIQLAYKLVGNISFYFMKHFGPK